VVIANGSYGYGSSGTSKAQLVAAGGEFNVGPRLLNAIAKVSAAAWSNASLFLGYSADGGSTLEAIFQLSAPTGIKRLHEFTALDSASLTAPPSGAALWAWTDSPTGIGSETQVVVDCSLV
jgi:hypothetical protein